MRRIRQFFASETAGGIIMMAATFLAILLANSPLSDHYHHFIDATLFNTVSIEFVVKDMLMVIFFFAVGAELKLEMREGALAAKGQKILPLIAAIGGIIIPALFYLAITHHHPELQAGWAIPTATDIAFALCIVRLAGPSIPASAKIFLLAIAIYDDLAAIVIIAFFYASGVALVPLLIVAALIALLFVLNRAHVDRVWVYLVVGIALGVALHAAGIHPTIAGVLTAMAVPMRNRTDAALLRSTLHHIRPYVAFGILPLFALTSAGVDMRAITLTDAFSALPMGIALALFLGKQVGIFAATFACVKLGISPLPAGVNWRLVYGVAILAGIGFTMSLFIGKLAFTDPQLLEAVKLGVLAGSLLSTVMGLIYLRVRATA